MRISDWSSDVYSSDLQQVDAGLAFEGGDARFLLHEQHLLQQRAQRRQQRLQGRRYQEAGIDVGELVRLALVVAEERAARRALCRPGDADRKSTRLNSSH